MWEANGRGDDSMLWAGTNFFGGISHHREGVCGAVSAMAVYLGMRFRSKSDNTAETNRAKETARAETSRLAQAFKDRFGSIVCQDLLDMPDSSEEQCRGYVRFVVEQLFGLE